jgi:hypothetical protein
VTGFWCVSGWLAPVSQETERSKIESNNDKWTR